MKTGSGNHVQAIMNPTNGRMALLYRGWLRANRCDAIYIDRVPEYLHFMPQPVANSVVAMLRGINSPKLPFQNQSPEKSFASPVDDAPNQRQERKAMTTYRATTEGMDNLGLRAVLKRYANDQWLPDHYTDQQRVGIVFDQFKRQVEDN